NDVLRGLLDGAVANFLMRKENALLLKQLDNRNSELVYLNKKLLSRVNEGDQALMNIRRRWDVAFNSISDPVIVVDHQYIVEGANNAATKLSGKKHQRTLDGHVCHQALFGHEKPC